MFSILRFYNIWVHIINQNIDAELHNKTCELSEANIIIFIN